MILLLKCFFVVIFVEDVEERSRSRRKTNSKQQRKQRKAAASAMMSDEDMINKIINGKMDDIELVPFKRFNTKWDPTTSSRHEYPIDVLTCGTHIVATADLSNRVNIWSLDPPSSMRTSAIPGGGGRLTLPVGDLIKSIKLSDNTMMNGNGGTSSTAAVATTSIWSICIDPSDR